MRMPWGKYRGEEFWNIPPGYLCWLLFESNASASIKNAARVELVDLFDLANRNCQRCEQLADTWPRLYRRLSSVCHPDCGGNVTAQKLVNELDDVMRGTLCN